MEAYGTPAEVCGFRVATCGIPVEACGTSAEVCGFRVATCGTPAEVGGFRVAGCGTRVPGCGSRLTACGFSVALCGYRVTELNLRFATPSYAFAFLFRCGASLRTPPPFSGSTSSSAMIAGPFSTSPVGANRDP